MPVKDWDSHWCPRCGQKASRKESYANGYCIQCGREYYRRLYRDDPKAHIRKQQSYYQRNRAKVCARTSARGRILKQETVTAYGGQCACCSTTHIEFLAIDHINGGRFGTISGHRHRKSIGSGGANFYRWLKKHNWPQGYRVLCHNCNVSYGFFGYCPHITPAKA